MNFVSEIVSHLQSTLNVKYLTKIGRDSSSNANNTMVYYPTDFPFYIEDVDRLLTIPYQQDTDTNTERTNQTDCKSPDRRTLENQQLPINAATQNNQEDNTRNKMPAILALRVMPRLIHLFQLYVSQIYKTILANGIV